MALIIVLTRSGKTCLHKFYPFSKVSCNSNNHFFSFPFFFSFLSLYLQIGLEQAVEWVDKIWLGKGKGKGKEKEKGKGRGRGRVFGFKYKVNARAPSRIFRKGKGGRDIFRNCFGRGKGCSKR